MKSKLPRSVSVGGVNFRIIVAETEEGEWGCMKFDDRQIILHPQCLFKPKELVSTLRHEITHAALHVSGLAFSEKYDEESIVRALDNIFWPAWEKISKKLQIP